MGCCSHGLPSAHCGECAVAARRALAKASAVGKLPGKLPGKSSGKLPGKCSGASAAALATRHGGGLGASTTELGSFPAFYTDAGETDPALVKASAVGKKTKRRRLGRGFVPTFSQRQPKSKGYVPGFGWNGGHTSPWGE